MKNKEFKITAVVLAAGKGKRMKASLPKILHPVCGEPLIFYSLSLLSSFKEIKETVVVLGSRKDEVRAVIEKSYKNIKFAEQKFLNGTAKAVESAFPEIGRENVLITCGDSPLLDKSVLRKFINVYKKSQTCSVLTEDINEDKQLGRIIRSEDGHISAVKEWLDLTSKEKEVKEVNTGIYLFKKNLLKTALKDIKINQQKKEYFLTDSIESLVKKGYSLSACKINKKGVFFSVNSRRDLIKAERLMRMYLIERLIDKGVRIIDPETTFLGPKTLVGKNSLIYPFTFIENNVKIGNSCSVGPFARVREGTVIRDNSHIGNFAEIVRSKVAENVKMKHFSYLGDTEVESGVNIGCGTVVANFDGKKKNKTKIKKGAFIGSDSILVSPVVIGRDAVTGAGSVVTRDVKDKTVVAGVPAKKLKMRKNV